MSKNVPYYFAVVLMAAGSVLAVDSRVPIATAQRSSLSLSPTSITGGGMVTGMVTLAAPAGSAGVMVKITSSAPQFVEVPQSVIVHAGATSASFLAQTHPVVVNPNVVASPPAVQISAQIGNATPTVATLMVLPPTLTALTLAPNPVGGGGTSTGTVTISGPAPAGGVVVPLSSQPTTPTAASPRKELAPFALSQLGVSMPSQVAIAAGATSATFAITTSPVSASTTFKVNATWGAFVTKTATLTVAPPALHSVKLSPKALTGGNPATGTVLLTGPAAGQGMTLTLRTDFAQGYPTCGSFPSVPSTVTVPPGAASVNFTVTTYPSYGTFWVEASSPIATAADDLTVMSPCFTPVVPASVKSGTSVQGKIRLTGPAMSPNCGNRFFLTSSNTTYAQVPAHVDVTPGSAEGTFPITTTAMPASSPPVTVTISATAIVSATGVNSALGCGTGHNMASANLTITP